MPTVRRRLTAAADDIPHVDPVLSRPDLKTSVTEKQVGGSPRSLEDDEMAPHSRCYSFTHGQYSCITIYMYI
jgi:hypothetical protein